MPKYISTPGNDERQDLLSCCKVLAIALFGWMAIRIALIPFEHGTFTPSNPSLQLNSNASSLLTIAASKQRIILIVGLHDALQRNLLDWSRSPGALPDWSYPIPTREDLKALRYDAPARYLSFDPLFATLRNDAYYYELDEIDEKVRKAIVELYRNKAQKAWSKGKNLVIASKYAAYLDDPKVTDMWLRILPEGVKVTDVQVVITYPTPRSHQLIQLWSTEHDPSRTTLKEYLSMNIKESFAQINPLGVATALSKKGMHTIIIDEKGFESEWVDLSTAIGCLLLKIRCIDNRLVGLGDYHRDEKPTMPMSMDLSNNKLKRMEKVLQDFDCGYFDSLSKSSNVYFLYRHSLFQHCSSLSRQYTAKEAAKQIQSIARGP